MSLVIADWTPLGTDNYYRKFELYTMAWGDQNTSINLGNFKVAAGMYGGPIALIKDDKKFLKVLGPSGKSSIHIFSASGQYMSSIKWQGGQIIHFAWSTNEDLLIIQDDGTVCIYDIFGNFQTSFGMGQEAKDTKVLRCTVFVNQNVTGIAILTSSYRIYVVTSIHDPRIRRLPEIPGIDIPPSCWVVIPHDRPKFLVGKEHELYLLDLMENHAQQQFPNFDVSVKAYVELAVSFDGAQVALFVSPGVIWIGSSDLQTKFCEFNTKCENRPSQLLWCGLDAVVGLWDLDLLVIGFKKDCLQYSFDSNVHLVSEIDGIRIIGNTTHEFLQKVPDVVKAIFRIGSMEPGAMLLEASKEFQKKSHQADEYIRIIKSQLKLAVINCVEAAGHDYAISTQKMLLKAAAFGKGFIPDMDPKFFVDMCQTLRVLNAVRDYTLGIPITLTQLHNLTMRVLLDRLVLRHQHCLAFRICNYLKMPEEEGTKRILGHWACYKVKQNQLDEEQVAIDIANKLSSTPGILYAEIADKANECGRKQLAIKLLDYEPRASHQVPLLLKLEQDKQAMLKAIESGDTDLIYFVIHHLRKNTLNMGDFQMAIRNFPAAHALYLKFCKEEKPDLLQKLYDQEDNYQAQASSKVLETFKMVQRPDNRMQCLQGALDLYKRARNSFAATATEDQIRLMRYQLKLESKLMGHFMNLSLHQTISLLLQQNENRLAEELRKEFKVTERKFYWIKIWALGEQGNWMELDKFSKSKKSPVGYEPFVDVCLKYNNQFEAKKYLPKVRPENKVNYFVKTGLLEDAANTAFEMRDAHALRVLQDKCQNTNKILYEKIEGLKQQLGVKK